MRFKFSVEWCLRARTAVCPDEPDADLLSDVTFDSELRERRRRPLSPPAFVVSPSQATLASWGSLLPVLQKRVHQRPGHLVRSISGDDANTESKTGAVRRPNRTPKVWHS